MSSFALVADPKSGIFEPEQLKGKPIGVSPFNGSHFTTLKLLEGFLKREQIKTTFAGTMRERVDALRRGEVAAISLMEPWISYAEKLGLRVIMESHSTRSEAAGDELDGPTLRKMFDAEAEAAKSIEKDPSKHARYLVEEAGGLIELEGSQARSHPQRGARALHARALPAHLRMDPRLGVWFLPGATYENTVDNRAWQ